MRHATNSAGSSAVALVDAGLAYGSRTLWSRLDLDVQPGEFVAVLGANGTGKSSLLRVLLGLTPLSQGRASVLGSPARRGRRDVGYVPQHRHYGADVALRARDLVRFGVDGHRWGLGGNRGARARVDELLDLVDATAYADAPVGRLSGGEQQRLRVAQALAADPGVLLCDEPLQSLDQHLQRTVVDLVDTHRHERDAAVLFVTHEINPVLGVADRVLYLTRDSHLLGPVEEVMTSANLSALYGTEVEVLRHGGRLIVLGADDADNGIGTDGPGQHAPGPPRTGHHASAGHDRVGA